MRIHHVFRSLSGRVLLCLLGVLVAAAPAFGEGYDLQQARKAKAQCVKKSLKRLQQQARTGDAQAQANLGWCYLWGWAVAEDRRRGSELLRKAAEQGQGLYYYGVALELQGRDEEAVAMFRKGAEQGDRDAMNKLGWCYYHARLGVPEDRDRAREWYQKAAELGHGGAADFLAFILPRNDPARKLYWYRKAWEYGERTAHVAEMIPFYEKKLEDGRQQDERQHQACYNKCWAHFSTCRSQCEGLNDKDWHAFRVSTRYKCENSCHDAQLDCKRACNR